MLYADNPLVEVVEISDIVYGQFQDDLVGVDAVIHTASPAPGRTDPEATMNVRSVFEGIYPFANNKLIFLLLGCY